MSEERFLNTCGVSEGGYQGHCLDETRHFKYDADFLTLCITFTFVFLFTHVSLHICFYYEHYVFLCEVMGGFYFTIVVLSGCDFFCGKYIIQ